MKYKSNYKICSNCVMDSSDEDILFDKKGICDHCNNFYQNISPSWHEEIKTKNKINDLKKKILKNSGGAEYDCLIGLSGGVDSSYLTLLAVEEMGLKPLLFHVDAGWNSQIAVNNINCLVDGLGLDLHTEVINWEEMKDLQLSFLKSGVPHIDTPQDHAFFATMYKYAKKYKIKSILTGSNFSTECVRNPIKWMYYQSDLRQLNHIHSLFGSKSLKTFPKTSILWHKFWLPYVKRIKVYTPLNFLEYKKNEAIRVLKNRFGWQEYPQKHFESRFTKFYESYWLYERFGFDVRRVQLSSLILTKQISRQEALEILKKRPYDKQDIKNEIQYVANKIDITKSELIKYFKAPKKSFEDYKNSYRLYKLGAFILEKTGLQVRGKR